MGLPSPSKLTGGSPKNLRDGSLPFKMLVIIQIIIVTDLFL